MLIEMARMSIDDGLVMQMHVGSTRNTNTHLFETFGPDMGADIPASVNWVAGLSGLLNCVGNDPKLRVLLFTLDESTYARELAEQVNDGRIRERDASDLAYKLCRDLALDAYRIEGRES